MVADDEQQAPRRRRRARTKDSGPEQEEEAARDEGGEQEPAEQEADEAEPADRESADEPEPAEPEPAEPEPAEPEPAEPEPVAEADAGRDDRDQDGGAVPAVVAARAAAQVVADFTGRRPEGVVSVERHDGEWQVGVEVVETHRIPDTTDVLAVYEVRLDGDGTLTSYRRTRRYARGQLDRECR
jgi:Gas vesicle synthesis protein GvpO